MKKLCTLLLAAGVTGMVSCKKETFNQNPSNPQSEGLQTTGNFNFTTTQDVNVDVVLRANTNEPIAGAIVNIYEPGANGNKLVYKGITDSNGQLLAKVNVPTGTKQLIVDPAYVGLIRNVTTNITSKSAQLVIGGKTGYSGNVVAEAVKGRNLKTAAVASQAAVSTNFTYPAPYTSAADALHNDTEYALWDGIPKYMEKDIMPISARLLKYVNNSLPESIPVQQHHPEYLNDNTPTTLRITKRTDVTITFVSEGASYQNSMAYYTYPTNNPPKTADAIKKALYLFPNASAAGTGGALQSGNQIKLGTFEAGTSIGFVVLRNAWTGTDVNTTVARYYSDNAFNPEGSTNMKKHSIVLKDDINSQYIIGFEDIIRTEAECDNDFNDIVFFAKATEADAIDDGGVPPVDNNVDTDGDGVNDNKDEYPDDPERAFNDYYPSKTTYAQWGFEDNWPMKGDYDMNDLVVNYRYQFVLNAQNKVVDLHCIFDPIAAGSSFRNGFGLQLPVAASTVKSVTGQKTMSNYITFAGNGVEAGQSKAVIIPFDNQDLVIKNPDGAYFVNTMMEKPKVDSKPFTISVYFNSPVNRAEMGVSAFNPFLISNLRRGVEVHLPEYKPTDKADMSLFGQGDDRSDIAGGRYYLSANGQPWALSYINAIKYPVETVNINQAYKHFDEWAKSNGTLFTDWYDYTKPGYANTNVLYLK